MKKNMKLGLTVLALAALAACGGGGGSTTPATTPVSSGPAIPVAPVVSNIVTTAPLSTYAAGTEELAAFSRLNAERNFCGFGVLAQNASLDKAALAHANWQIANNTFGHYETAGTPFFTGVMPIDRTTAAGYITSSGAVTDEIAGNAYNVKTGFGEIGTRGLLNAPYHLPALFTGYRDVGISLRNSTDLGTASPYKVLQFNLAYKAADGMQLFDPSEVKTYPCDGSVGMTPNMSGESPNPVPGRDLFTNPLGSTVYVALREGNVLKITGTTMTNMATGAPVTLRAPLTSTNDPNVTANGSYFRSNQALITADAAMTPFTRYQVTVNGTNNGVAFSRTFAFTTGPTATQ